MMPTKCTGYITEPKKIGVYHPNAKYVNLIIRRPSRGISNRCAAVPWIGTAGFPTGVAKHPQSKAGLNTMER
jgi:hypothetical protein